MSSDRMTELFFEVHEGLPRQAPGSAASTARAFAVLRDLPAKPAILDIGCGPGAQSVQLAQLCDCAVTGIDNHAPFLEEARMRAESSGVSDRVQFEKRSMLALPYKDQTFDVVWSEGVIYIMGFESGLREWKRLLKPGGWMVLTECTWLTKTPSAEVKAYWKEGYPAMATTEKNLQMLCDCGYETVEHFTLPASDWMDEYYKPLKLQIDYFCAKYADDRHALEMLQMELAEIDLYKRHGSEYGYVFYIARLV